MNFDWRRRTLVIGGIIGLLTGLGAAYMIVQRSDDKEQPPEINVGDGVRLGLLLLGLVRQVSEITGGRDE